MALGKKYGGRDFKKGDPRCGRKPLPPEILKAKHLAHEDFLRTALTLFESKHSALQKILDDENEIVRIKIIAAVMHYALEGNMSAVNILFDRIYGKVPDRIEHSGTINQEDDLSKIPLEKLEQILTIYESALRKNENNALDK